METRTFRAVGPSLVPAGVPYELTLRPIRRSRLGPGSAVNWEKRMSMKNPQPDEYAKELAHRQRQRESLTEWWERLNLMSSTWDLETGKHLVVLNAAGFAGVSTLLAGSKPFIPQWIGPVTLLGYGFAVMLAVSNMYLAGKSFDRMAEEIKDRIGTTWDLSESTAGIFDRPKAGRKLNVAGQVCGWISAILAAGSTATVGISLVSR